MSLDAPNTQSQSRLFALPRELRDMIYERYLSVGNGNSYRYETNKLVAANNHPIDVAPIYTCTLAATEMKGLALSLNTIHFSTVYDTDLSEVMGDFAALVQKITVCKSCILWAAHICIDSNTAS